MFAYCGNNPVIHSDSNGTLFLVDDVTAILFVTYGTAFLVILLSPEVQQLIYDFCSGIVTTFDKLLDQINILLQAQERNRSLPKEGEPNSDSQLEDNQGNTKQQRHYGNDGQAEFDIDYQHSNGDGTHEFPHVHIWWNGSRGVYQVPFGEFFYLLEWGQSKMHNTQQAQITPEILLEELHCNREIEFLLDGVLYFIEPKPVCESLQQFAVWEVDLHKCVFVGTIEDLFRFRLPVYEESRYNHTSFRPYIDFFE